MTLSPIVPVWLVRTEVDYVGDAAEHLASSPVYVDSSADLSSTNAIEAAAQEHGVAVVAFPRDATQILDANTLAGQLLRATDEYEAVIVVIDDGSSDYFGAATDKPADTIALKTALNGANDGDGGAAVLTTLQNWRTSTSGGSGDSNDDGSGFGTVVGVGAGLVGLAVVAAAGALVVRRLRQGGTATTARDVPEELRHVLARLDSLQTMHGSEFDPAAAQRLTSIRANVRELFRRIRRTGTEQQVRIASIEYIDVLTKLERALGPDYYLDLIRSPRLWENAAARRTEVEEAVAATDDQLVTNIRQVNASQDLEFKVALESLVGSMNATVKDIYADADDTRVEQTTDHPTDPQGDKPS
jgi:hypothetical protein